MRMNLAVLDWVRCLHSADNYDDGSTPVCFLE